MGGGNCEVVVYMDSGARGTDENAVDGDWVGRERGMQAGAVDEIHESDGEKTKYLPHLERPGLHCVR